MTTNDKVKRILLKMPKYELAQNLGITHKTLNERIQNDTWKKLEIEKINRL
jgi:DNA-binding XRE family transcriptional regulator